MEDEPLRHNEPGLNKQGILESTPYLRLYSQPIPYSNVAAWRSKLDTLGEPIAGELSYQQTPSAVKAVIQAVSLVGRNLGVFNRHVSAASLEEATESLLICGYELGAVAQYKDARLFEDDIYQQLYRLNIISGNFPRDKTKRFLMGIIRVGINYRKQGPEERTKVSPLIQGFLDTLSLDLNS